jgi:hypothetical protein
MPVITAIITFSSVALDRDNHIRNELLWLHANSRSCGAEKSLIRGDMALKPPESFHEQPALEPLWRLSTSIMTMWR